MLDSKTHAGLQIIGSVLGTLYAMVQGCVIPYLKGDLPFLPAVSIVLFGGFLVFAFLVFRIRDYESKLPDPAIEEVELGRKVVRLSNSSFSSRSLGGETTFTFRTNISLFSKGRRVFLSPNKKQFSIVETWEGQSAEITEFDVEAVGGKAQVVFLLDSSQSMNLLATPAFLERCQSRFDVATQVVRTLLRRVKAPDLVVRVGWFSGPRDGFRFYTGLLSPSRRRGDFEDQVKEMSAEGGTQIWMALRRLTELLEEESNTLPTVVVLVTDGDNVVSADIDPQSAQRIDLEHLREALVELDCPIVTVTTCGGNDEVNQDLIELSEITGAGVENVGAFTELEEKKFGELAKVLSKAINSLYAVTWTSKLAAPGKQIAIRIRFESKGALQAEQTFIRSCS